MLPKSRLFRVVFYGFLIIGFSGVAVLSGPRVRVAPHVPITFELAEDLDQQLQISESRVAGLKPGTEKMILWNDPQARTKTERVLVYLHGFSASRSELTPVTENLARHFGANVFFTRLKGHGLDGDALGDATVNDWYQDADEAIAYARRLGNRITLIGMSNGAVLATWVASRNPELEALVLLSPNFDLADKRSSMLLWPWGLYIARAILGNYRSFTPEPAEQAKFWTTRYRVEGLLQMRALVDVVHRLDLSRISVPLVVLYTHNDATIDVSAVKRTYEQFGSTKKTLIDVQEAHRHVIAGAVCSPNSTDAVVTHITTFLDSIYATAAPNSISTTE